MTAGHTFYLEELNVKAGDFVSYYARAADNDTNGGKRQTSDIYFLQIRPLRKEFKRAESDAGAGGGGGGGGGGQVGALSQQQRQIVAATFNVNRDRKTMTADKVRENSVVLALSQAKLRDQVDGLLTRMNSRLVQQDPSFKKIADLLPQAVAEMKNAEAKLQKADPQGALEPEQKALQILQHAEEEYETQVQMGRQQGGGGGGGGGGAMAEDLADLFELELDKMANQYETAQRAQQQQSDQQVDELLEKLKELARRQEQEAERQRRRAQAGQGGGGGRPAALARRTGRGSGAAAGAAVARGEPARARRHRAPAAAGRRSDAPGVGQRTGRDGAGRLGARSAAGSAEEAPAVADRPRRARRAGCAAAGRGDRARAAADRRRRQGARHRGRRAAGARPAAERAQG